MLTISNLSFAYNKKSEVVINNISLMLDKGLYSIIGVNGSGKTTLLNLIFGLLPPSSGSIEYSGNTRFRKHVAYVATENYFFSHITGREHLSLFSNDNFDEKIWGEIFKLPLDSYISSYSTGMKKKLAILTSLKMDKDVYIFDEPFNGLDLESCHIVSMILQKLKSKKTIIVTSHILDVLEGICDCYYFLSKGEIKNEYKANQFSLLKQAINELITNENKDLINDALK